MQLLWIWSQCSKINMRFDQGPTAFLWNQERHQVTPEIPVKPVDRQSFAAVWTAAGRALSVCVSAAVHKAGPAAHRPPPLHRRLIKAPSRRMLWVKRWRARGWGSELSRAQLLSTHTHSVQLLLLDELRGIYKIPSIKEDDAACHDARRSPKQNIGQSLSPSVTWRRASHRNEWKNFTLLQHSR